MTTQNIFLVWHDEQIRSIFTTRAAAEAFVETHLGDQKDVWISSRVLHDVDVDEVTPPQKAYVVSYASSAERLILAQAFGKDLIAAPESERAVPVLFSKFDARASILPLEKFESLPDGEALVVESATSDAFQVIAKQRDVAEDAYMERLISTKCAETAAAGR